MSKDEKGQQTMAGRVQLIETVQTPLGFFVLVVLVVEAILGIVAGFSQGSAQNIAVCGMLSLIGALIFVVTFLAYKRPEALRGIRPESKNDIAVVSQIERIEVERVFCASTEEYDHLGIEKDAEVLRNAYNNVHLNRKIPLNEFRKVLSSQSFEIVHFLGFVHPQNGKLRFSENDSLSPEGFLKLLQLSGARLAFLATCDSLFLAARLAPHINVVAASGFVQIERMVLWQSCFYDLLSRGYALSEAYEVAQTTTDVPMVLLMKRDMILFPQNSKFANPSLNRTAQSVGASTGVAQTQSSSVSLAAG